MASTLSPLRYPGGKSSTYKYIRHLININDATSYIEPYAGGAGVAISLLLNGDVKRIIINDFDKSIYAFWYSVKYHTHELIEMITNCEINIEEWYRQKEIQKNKKNIDDLLALGFSTLFLNRTNRSGIIKGGIIGGKNQTSNYTIDCRFNKVAIIKKIERISKKSKYIDIYNLDALDFIDTVIKRTRKSFTFFDPPYFEKGPSLYTNFYKKDDHEVLANKIQQNLKNRKWIVTYDHVQEIKNMYGNLPHIEYYLNYSAQNKTKGIEYMFYSERTCSGNPDSYLNMYFPFYVEVVK